jgi:hypothetical protein
MAQRVEKSGDKAYEGKTNALWRFAMSQPERNNLIDELLRKTEQGRVQDWNERLASVARLTGIDLTRVAWSKPPRFVATDIADECRRTGREEEFVRAVNDLP